MTFFNKKEDVIDIELTQLGKYLLSKGKFAPSFYAFSDDEILYDVSHAGQITPETGRQTSNRIQKETQRIKTLYEHDGVESRITELNGHEVEKLRGFGWNARVRNRTEEELINHRYGVDLYIDEKMGADDRNLLRNMVGSSKIGEQASPCWQIDSLYNGIIESVNVSSSSPNVGIKRPVVNIEIDYEINGEPLSPADLRNVDEFDTDYLRINRQGETVQHEIDLNSPLDRRFLFTDGVAGSIPNSPLIISIIEDNVQYDLDNFEYEIYEIESVTIDEKRGNIPVEKLRPLKNSDLRDTYGPLFGADHTSINVNKKYTEHYFTHGSDDLVQSIIPFERGTNPFRIKENLEQAIIDFEKQAQQIRETVDRIGQQSVDFVPLPNPPGECED